MNILVSFTPVGVFLDTVIGVVGVVAGDLYKRYHEHKRD